MRSYEVARRRSMVRRLTPVGWFLIALALILVGLVGLAGCQWLQDRVPAPPATGTPVAPATTGVPPAQPTATAVVTETAPFPATWAEGMWQDAQGKWWPAEEVRAEIQEQVKQHYLEAVAVLDAGTELDALEQITDEQARRYQTGQALEDWFAYKRRYLESGWFNPISQEIDAQLVTVQSFGADGLTVTVSETYQAAHLLEYDATTGAWNRIDIPEDGIHDGTQYLGVVVLTMAYDTEDGRWKIAHYDRWIPRP